MRTLASKRLLPLWAFDSKSAYPLPPSHHQPQSPGSPPPAFTAQPSIPPTQHVLGALRTKTVLLKERSLVWLELSIHVRVGCGRCCIELCVIEERWEAMGDFE